MRRFRWLIWGLLLFVLAGGAGFWMSGRGDQVGKDHLANREEILGLLASEGVQVKRDFGTNAYAIFDLEPDAALGVETDAGFMQIILFPETVEGRLEVEQVGEYGWKVHNWRPVPQSMGSNHTLYFTIHRNLFIMADNEQVHAQAQRVFN